MTPSNPLQQHAQHLKTNKRRRGKLPAAGLEPGPTDRRPGVLPLGCAVPTECCGNRRTRTRGIHSTHTAMPILHALRTHGYTPSVQARNTQHKRTLDDAGEHTQRA